MVATEAILSQNSGASVSPPFAQNPELERHIPASALPKPSPQSAFILGPRRAPIPAKLVNRIVSLEYIDMSELIPENLDEPQAESPVFTFEGATVVAKPNPSKKRNVSDVLMWVECFTSYTAVITCFFLSRSRYLLAYMVLIIRTAKRFGGTPWLDYDCAYRREAAASNRRDWSVMRPDLYNYHTSFVHRTVPHEMKATSLTNRRSADFATNLGGNSPQSSCATCGTQVLH